MKWLNCEIIRLVVVVFLASVMFGSSSAKADLVVGDPVFVEGVLNSPGTNNTQGHSLLHNGLKMYYIANHSGISGIWVTERESMDSPWGEPVYLSPYLNPDILWAAEITVSPDDLELYFWQSIDNVWYVMRSIRSSTDEDWGRATEYIGIFPDDFSSDGLTKYTYDNFNGGYGGSDIWITTRATIEDEWGDTVNLGPNVNDSYDQANPSISNDGLALFFRSNGRVKMCTRSSTNDDWGPAIDLDFDYTHSDYVYTSVKYYDLEISPDGSTLYLASHRTNNLGNLESYWQASVIPIVDFNGDRVCDIDDLVIMIENWDTDNTLCDIGPMPWGDGVVNNEDLIVFMEHWGEDHSLIAHWKLDETEGDVAYDSIGENNGIIYGEPLWQPDGGIIDGAIELDGIDDYISTQFIINPAKIFSVFAWVKGGAPGQVIVSQEIGANWLMLDQNTGCLMTELKASASRGGHALTSQVVIADDLWHLIGFVWDGTNRILYVDDTEVASDTQDGIFGSNGGLYIGAGKGLESGTFWSGLIDDVRIYDRAITP